MAGKVEKIVTEKIIAALEKGEIPWVKPWTGRAPQNYVTGKAYQGINVFMLAFQPYKDNRYLTFKQVKNYGGNVKKGEKGHMVVYYFRPEKEVKQKDGTVEKKRSGYGWYLYYTVFNVEQTENWNPRPMDVENAEAKPIDRCEAFVKNLPEAPEIQGSNDKAYYCPALDYVGMPDMKQFKSEESYYSVLFHELTHWTGSEKRLGRFQKSDAHIFGSEKYSKEELVAELGAAFICAETGISNTETIQNSAAYIQSWKKKLKEDNTLIFKAASKASAALRWMKDEKSYQEQEDEQETATEAA